MQLPELTAPTFSVVICNHNYAAFLGESIASALAQAPRCQVVVVDDGSTDGSRELLATADPRVEVVLQPAAGQLAAYASGFARCTGSVVFFLDADDALRPGALAAIAARFSAGVAKVHVRMDLVDAQGLPLGGHVPSQLVEGDVLGPLQRHGVLYPSPPGSGNAYRRDVLERLFPLPLDANDRVGADFFLIYGSVAFGTVASCGDRSFANYRLHRRAEAPADALVFGNAALGNDEANKVARRYARLRDWLAERTGGRVRLPASFVDFSVQKSVFATAVLDRPYAKALVGSGADLASILRTVWLQPAYGWKKRLGLSAWAVLVVVAPRPTAFRLARYVCNPASRGA